MNRVELLQLLGILSGLMFVGSLLVVPWMVSRLSDEFFIRHRRRVGQRRKRHPVLTFLLWLLRNSIGVILLGSGLVMLVLPGQGILTILVGIALMDFPGKYRLLERFIELKQVRRSLNWIRRKAGKSEFVFKDDM
ncbi:MAG: hypothetical protein L3J49_01775 [Desulfobulbaceae bacterium]|nr:hypothetical protein [Desulfobulbaceae bacterium]